MDLNFQHSELAENGPPTLEEVVEVQMGGIDSNRTIVYLLEGAEFLSLNPVGEPEYDHQCWVGNISIPNLTGIFGFAGEGTDCETCGWSPAEATVIVSRAGASIESNYGCYSGLTVHSLKKFDEEKIGLIMDELEHIQLFMSGDFKGAFRALDALK